MRKKLYAQVALALTALVALASCGPMPPNPGPAPTSATLTKVTIALGYLPNVQFAPFYVALNEGYYREEGLDVTFTHGIVPDLIRLLGAGDEGVNFAAASGDEIIPARLQGIPVKYVMTWYRQYPVAAASVEGRGPTLRNPEDLKGRTVGVPGAFGASYTGLQALLKAGGMTLNDIDMKVIGFTQVESLAVGQVDVAMVYAANEPVQLRSQGLQVSALMVSDYVGLAANGLVTNEKTLQENPELVRKVVRATLKGIQSTIDDPAAAFESSLLQVPEAGSNNTRELQMQVLQETVKLMQPKPGDPAAQQPPGWIDADVWRTTQDFLLDLEVIKEEGDVEEMFTNEFVGP